MGEAKVVNAGIDTLVLNVFYTDERGRPVKHELDLSLRLQLDEWKRAAQEVHDECPTTLVFHDAVLHLSPNGAGQGQWPWMLKTQDITLYVSGGHWNGIASVRFSSQYLWSCRGVSDAIVSAQAFLDEVFKSEMYLQVSSVDLCVDVAGWEDVERLDRVKNFVSRSRKRMVRDEAEWVGAVKSRDYSVGLQRTGFDFSRSKYGLSALSCRIYDKSRELDQSGKEWFIDLWRSHGWSEEDGRVWRVEFSFKRETLHELQQENISREVVFWGIEDAYELPDRLPVLWAYATGQVEGGPDGVPDGWIRCVVESPPQFGKIVRKRWEEHNIDKGIEQVIGYLTSLAAWAGGELAEEGADLSMVLHWLAGKGGEYLERIGRDFSLEVQRKRLKFSLQSR